MTELANMEIFVRSASSIVEPSAMRALTAKFRSQGKEFTEYQPTMLTTSEAAEIAGVSAATIRQWVQRGKLNPTGKRGRSLTFDKTTIPRVSTGHGTPKDIYLDEHMRWKDSKSTQLFTANELIPRISTSTHSISKATLRSWVARGLIPVRGKRSRSNLYALQDIEQLMSARRRKSR